MGQKVNPVGFRVGNGNDRTWPSIWFAKKDEDYVNNVWHDILIQRFFAKNASKYAVGNVEIERKQNNKVRIILKSAKINCVIGKKGENIAQIEKA